MKKIMIGVLICLIAIGITYAIISNPTPLADDYVDNSASPTNYLFAADTSTANPNINVYLNDIWLGQIACIAGVCSGNLDIFGKINDIYDVSYMDSDAIKVSAPGNLIIDTIDPTTDDFDFQAAEYVVTFADDCIDINLDPALTIAEFNDDLGGWTPFNSGEDLNITYGVIAGSSVQFRGYCEDYAGHGTYSTEQPTVILPFSPPADPTIVAVPVEGSTIPVITITYAEPVYNVKIYTGTSEFDDLGNITIENPPGSGNYTYDWDLSLPPGPLLADAMYLFTITAEDDVGNAGEFDFIYSTTDENATIIIGDAPPEYSGIVETLTASYDPLFDTILDINWTDDVGIVEVLFDLNGVTYVFGIDPEITNIGDTYTATFTGLNAGAYNYTWNATDTAGQKNSTGILPFIINKALPDITLNVPTPVNEFSAVNVDCSSTTSAVTLYRDGELLPGLTDISVLEYNASNYLYECVAAENLNYQADTASDTLVILDNGPFSLFRAGIHPRTSAPPGQWIVLNYEIEMSGGDGAKVRMNDLVDASIPATIQINEDSQPVLLCTEDYSGDYTEDPTTYLTPDQYYLVDNIYNALDDAVYCTSARTPDEIGLYSFILMIPLPITAEAGTYNANIYFQPWQS